MRNACSKTLTEIASKNKGVVLLTADLGFTVFEKFVKDYPKQFFNMGVAEANMMGVACGMAMCGFIPVVYSIATFATMRGFEQIRGDIALHKANVKIVGSGAGLSYGHAGNTHQALEDIALMRTIPEMLVVCPCDSLSTQIIVKEIIKYQGPVYLRLGKRGEPPVYSQKPKIRLGRANILSEGRDVMILATGNLVYNAVVAEKLLVKKGIKAGVVDMHTVKPLDKKLVLDLIGNTQLIVTLEEHHLIGGLGSAAAEVIAESPQKNILFMRLGLPDRFISTVGNQEYLRKIYKLTPVQIASSISAKLKLYA